jgi:hypothetical protein
MRSSVLLGSLLTALCVPVPASAQQPAQEPDPPMVAASYYECTGAAADVDQLIESTWQPVMTEQTSQGKLLNWGVLRHAWADEWNLVLYRTVADLTALQASQETLTASLLARNAQWQTSMARLCPRHKDNIYWATASGPNPPSGQAPRPQGQ